MTIYWFDFSRKFSISKEKNRTVDINPILHKMTHFDRVNRKNKKRDKSQKQDLSRCVAPPGIEPGSKV